MLFVFLLSTLADKRGFNFDVTCLQAEKIQKRLQLFFSFTQFLRIVFLRIICS